jgi:hypothetical protein
MSTNVLWAGNIAGAPVVSIFNNPTGYEGNNDPVYNRFSNFDRIYLDSRFNYLTVRWQLDLTFLFNSVAIGGSGEKISTIGLHNFGYPPATILLDTDTREVITNNSYIQIVNYTSVRTLSLLIDNNKFYFKEKYDNTLDDLPSITRRYTLLAFDNSAQVP